MNVIRYNNISVALHWLIVPLLLLTLFMGSTALVDLGNDDPEKLGALKGHMIFGFLITSLMIVRLIVKLRSVNPAPIESGHSVRDWMGKRAHYLLYILVILMGLSGFAIALMAGVPAVVLGMDGAVLPETFNNLLPRLTHGVIAKLLMGLVLLHVVATLYHQLILKDNIIARMGFGQPSKTR